MPILARENSIIKFGNFQGSTVYDYIDGINFVIYGLGDGVTATTTVCDSNGQTAMRLTAKRSGGVVTATHDAHNANVTVQAANGSLHEMNLANTIEFNI